MAFPCCTGQKKIYVLRAAPALSSTYSSVWAAIRWRRPLRDGCVEGIGFSFTWGSDHQRALPVSSLQETGRTFKALGLPGADGSVHF